MLKIRRVFINRFGRARPRPRPRTYQQCACLQQTTLSCSWHAGQFSGIVAELLLRRILFRSAVSRPWVFIHRWSCRMPTVSYRPTTLVDEQRATLRCKVSKALGRHCVLRCIHNIINSGNYLIRIKAIQLAKRIWKAYPLPISSIFSIPFHNISSPFKYPINLIHASGHEFKFQPQYIPSKNAMPMQKYKNY